MPLSAGATPLDSTNHPADSGYSPGFGTLPIQLGAPTADTTAGASGQQSAPVMTTSTLYSASSLTSAVVAITGELKTTEGASQVFYDAFDVGLDTVNLWKSPTASGGAVAATNTVGSSVLASGTTIGGYSYLESAVSFKPNGVSYAVLACTVALEYPVQTKAHRYWGNGTSPGTPTTAIPITDGVGFEVDTTGKMFCVIYASGARSLIQDLSVATGNGKQPQDAFPHSYVIFLRGDKYFYTIDGPEKIVGQTYFQQNPNVETLPIKFSVVAGNPAPTSSLSLTCYGSALADASRTIMQVADGLYPWRKMMIGADRLLNMTVGGTTTVAIAASLASNTVVKATSGRLARVLVTATGTNPMAIYDNASTASGTIIGALPASPTVGSVYDFQLPALSGITVGGNAANPGVTVSYY